MKTSRTTPTPTPKPQPLRRKHVPQRTCVGCRQSQGKRVMVRVVRTPEAGVVIDPTGKRAGRGAYICADPPCWEAALKGRLEHALKTTLTPDEREMLRMYAAGLPKTTDAPAKSDA
ncbi:MAG: YlxR family protein [Anaerolineae bacterium]|nr:YlxR family protein [Anaerolineae bacterium]